MCVHVLIPTTSNSSFQHPRTRPAQPAKQMCADPSSNLASASVCVPACLPWRLFLPANLYRRVCVFRGEKPAGLMKSNLTTPFRQDIPQHLAVHYRNGVFVGVWGGGGCWVQSDPPIALKDSETWRGYLKLKPHCSASFYSVRGGGSCQTIEQERTHTLFLSLSLGEWVGEWGVT